MDTPKQSRARWARIPLACLFALGTGAVLAQANPYYVGAAQAFTHESNLFRVDSGTPATSDTLSSTSLLAGLDQPIGRQRLFADLALRANRFADNSQLNHTGYGALAGLDWSAADAFAGRLSFGTEKTLARYGSDLGFTSAGGRVLQTSQEAILRGQYGLVSLLSIEAALVHRDIDYSVQSGNAFEQDSVALGLKYRPSEALTLGIGLRRTEGSYPFTTLSPGNVQADDFDRNDVDMTALWIPTGASTITARLSRTSEKHQAAPARDLMVTTGALSWNLKVTGKLNATAEVIRDTGAEQSFSGGAAGAAAATVSSPLATTWQLNADYEATAKIRVLALARYLRRDLNSGADAITGDDSLTEWRLGVNWTPLRSVLVGCSVGREERSTSSSLSFAYSATTTRCLAQFKTQ